MVLNQITMTPEEISQRAIEFIKNTDNPEGVTTQFISVMVKEYGKQCFEAGRDHWMNGSVTMFIHEDYNDYISEE